MKTKTKATAKKDNKKSPKTEGFGSIYDIIRKPVRDKVLFETIADYENYLRGLNMVDLQNHAVTIGLKPGRDRQLLISTLIRQFAKEKAQQFGASNSMNDDQTNKVLTLLARSR